MIESVGTVKAIYTVEPHPENEHLAVVTYWLENGALIGQTNVQREPPQRCFADKTTIQKE